MLNNWATPDQWSSLTYIVSWRGGAKRGSPAPLVSLQCCVINNPFDWMTLRRFPRWHDASSSGAAKHDLTAARGCLLLSAATPLNMSRQCIHWRLWFPKIRVPTLPECSLFPKWMSLRPSSLYPSPHCIIYTFNSSVLLESSHALNRLFKRYS